MDFELKNKMDVGALYEMYINGINEFYINQNTKINFKVSDIRILEQIIDSKNILNNTIIQKGIKRKINYIFNSKKKDLQFKKRLSLNNNKYFHLYMYINILDINNKLNDQLDSNEEEKYILYFKKIFLLSIELYKNNFLHFHPIFIFFDFYFELIKNYDLILKCNINNIILIINFIKKIIKISNYYNSKNFENKENEKNLINKDIYNIFEKIFKMNNKDKIKNIIFCKNILKCQKILDLFKICFDYYNNDIVDINNKNYIKNNLFKLFLNNFNHKHLDYFYHILKKFLFKLDINIKFNKKYFSFFNQIIEFLFEIAKNEKQFIEKDIFYCDKYFLFDSSENKTGIKTSPIIFNNNYDLGLSIIFSFYAIQSYNLINNEQIILSFNNAENNNFFIFKILLIKNSLYIYTKSGQKYLIMENINYNCFNLCFLYYDQTMIYFFINNDYKFFEEKNILKSINKIYVEIGYSILGNGKFNGIIGPVILFNSIIKKYFDIFNNIKKNLKGKYYLVGEILNEENNNNDNNKNIYFSYEEYKGLFNYDINIIKKIKNNLGNLILYINPDIVLNNINFFEQKKFRDYQNYKSIFDVFVSDKKSQIIYYEFMTKKNINNLVFKENNIFQFFINNHGFNLIILIIESIYNYLLIVKNDTDYSEYLTIM